MKEGTWPSQKDVPGSARWWCHILLWSEIEGQTFALTRWRLISVSLYLAEYIHHFIFLLFNGFVIFINSWHNHLDISFILLSYFMLLGYPLLIIVKTLFIECSVEFINHILTMFLTIFDVHKSFLNWDYYYLVFEVFQFNIFLYSVFNHIVKIFFLHMALPMFVKCQ